MTSYLNERCTGFGFVRMTIFDFCECEFVKTAKWVFDDRLSACRVPEFFLRGKELFMYEDLAHASVRAKVPK